MKARRAEILFSDKRLTEIGAGASRFPVSDVPFCLTVWPRSVKVVLVVASL